MLTTRPPRPPAQVDFPTEDDVSAGAVAILRALLVQQPHERLGSNGADEARSFHEPP